MRKVTIFITLLIIASGAYAAEPERKSFYMELKFTQASDKIDVNVEKTEFRQVTTDSTFYKLRENVSIRLETKKGKKMFSGNLPVSFLTYSNTYPPSTPKSSKTTELEVYLPYNKSAVSALILHNSKIIGNVSLTKKICRPNRNCISYCRGKKMVADCTCGDGICQENLNERELCPQDCRDSPSSDETNDNEGGQSGGESIPGSGDTEDVVDSGTNTGILVVIGILALIAAVILASSKVKIEA